MVAVVLLAVLIAAGRFLVQWQERNAYRERLAGDRAALAAVRIRAAKANTSKPTSPVPTLAPSTPN
jgi:hypothetical protein